jgi:hypothetical protein
MPVFLLLEWQCFLLGAKGKVVVILVIVFKPHRLCAMSHDASQLCYTAGYSTSYEWAGCVILEKLH